MEKRVGSRKDSGSQLMRGASILKVRPTDQNPDIKKAEETKKKEEYKETQLDEEDEVSSGSSNWDGGTALSACSNCVAEKNDPEEDRYHMEYFNSAMMASVLEDTLAALRILDSANIALSITECKANMPNLLVKKYGIIIEPQTLIESLESVKTKNIDSEEYKIKKFMADRAQLTSSLAKIYTELSLDGKFRFLMTEVQKGKEESHRNQKLQEEADKIKLEVKEMRKQVRLQRAGFKRSIFDTNAKLENMTHQIQDANLMKEVKGRYVHNWQISRREQLNQQIKNKENITSDDIEMYKRMYDNEQRAHTDMENIVNILLEDTLNEIEKWMDKYETDIEEIDLAIQVKRNDYEKILDKRLYLDKKYDHRTRDMESWIQFKKDREEKRLYVIKMNKSASIVQAWWRGMLVRHSMGPYKPRGKKGRRRKNT